MLLVTFERELLCLHNCFVLPIYIIKFLLLGKLIFVYGIIKYCLVLLFTRNFLSSLIRFPAIARQLYSECERGSEKYKLYPKDIRTPWFDKDCLAITERKLEAYQRMRARGCSPQSYAEYKALRREEKKRHRRKKRQ